MARRSNNPIYRLLLTSLGLACLILAGLGFTLPGLPGTPFLLLAAACFARSSPRLHGWLVANRFFGPIISNWEESRSIPRRAKRLAIGMILVAGAISLYSLQTTGLRLLLLALLTIPLVIVIRLKESEAVVVPHNDTES